MYESLLQSNIESLLLLIIILVILLLTALTFTFDILLFCFCIVSTNQFCIVYCFIINQFFSFNYVNNLFFVL
jgi:hypothetical protein